ncbi:MAG: hypothetical protein DCC75_06595 [Proteobacteria bacterium]|nr:MAG: hypothetical protein DCC75_06595 [Pseudomonadota bacterium]
MFENSLMARKNIFQYLSCFAVILLSLGGCEPGLGKSISVSKIEGTEKCPSAANLEGRIFRVGQFQDRRGSSPIGEIDNRMLEPASDPAQSVKGAVEQQLKACGASLSLFTGPYVSGEVLDWKVRVYPKFPASDVEAFAKLRLQVLDGVGKQIYSAAYSGSVSESHPALSGDQVESNLGAAMALAISEAFRNDGFLESLRRVSQ